MKKKLFLVLILFICMAGTTFAMDFTNFPEIIQPGDFMVSAFVGGGEHLAVLGAVDYALGLPVPLTVGAELGYAIGFGFSFGTVIFPDYATIPILARVGYHPDFGVNNLNVYFLAKLGCFINLGSYTEKGDAGFAYGFDIGARYFFTPQIGVFGEAGYNLYGNGDFTAGSSSGSSYVATYFSAGITFKF